MLTLMTGAVKEANSLADRCADLRVRRCRSTSATVALTGVRYREAGGDEAGGDEAGWRGPTVALGLHRSKLGLEPSGSLPMLAGITPTQTGRAAAEGSS